MALLFLNTLSKKREVITLCAQPGGEREGRRRGEGGEERRRRGEGGEWMWGRGRGEGGEREGSGCGREGGEGGGKSTIPSALVGGGHVSGRGLQREDVMCHLYP